MTQPKDPQEPRQFWIDDILNVDRPYQKTAYIHEQDTEKCHRAIHVIEFSAYQSIQSKLEKAEAENKRLREALEFYGRLDNWEISAIDDLVTVKTKLTKDKESFGECAEAGLASKLVYYGGKRARQALKGEGE